MFKYLVISDIHLGHNVNKTHYIINNLNTFFSKYRKDLNNLNTIFIAGDIFDKLLSNSSQDYLMATEWLTDLIIYCKLENIKLRILEGTPSHDWKQAKLISTIITKLNIELDFKYIDTLYIEYMEQEDIYILYIPDEYKPKAEDTLKEVKEKLKELNITQVDIAIMHGQFNYQLPMVKLDSSHNEEEYLNIVKKFISIGHIHTPSIFNRILAQGSFDRLAHNEEEDKGAMLITITKENGDTYKFLKNDNAMVFKTMRFNDEPIDIIISKVSKVIEKLPMNSNIRIIAHSEDKLYSSVKELSKAYPMCRIKTEKIKQEKETKKLIKEEIINNSLVINKDNIMELILEEVKSLNIDSKELNILQEELTELI